MVKGISSLRPFDHAAEEALSKIKMGSAVSVEIKRPRNIQMHKLYWALIGIVHENQDRYETTEQLHSAIKIAAGHYDLLTMPSGQEYKIPKSISFEKMDQTEFSQFYDRVCDLVAKHFLPGVNVQALKAEVQQMIGAA